MVVPEWISAPFVSPGKGGTAQYGIPRRGDGGGGVEWRVTSGGERREEPLLSPAVVRLYNFYPYGISSHDNSKTTTKQGSRKQYIIVPPYRLIFLVPGSSHFTRD